MVMWVLVGAQEGVGASKRRENEIGTDFES